MLIGIVITVLFVVILLRVFKLYRADGDLRLLSHTLKPAYFKDKVVWVTGASSGSKQNAYVYVRLTCVHEDSQKIKEKRKKRRKVLYPF